MAKKESEKTKKLKEKLSLKPELVWDTLSKKEIRDVTAYAKDYCRFLDEGRTERRAVAEFVRMARHAGFVELGSRKKSPAGFYQTMRGKMLAIAVPGRRPMTEGLRLVTSHVDCPRLDLKSNPLYEDTDLALFKTHYYGGVKKYQWVARHLAVVGTVIRRNGKAVDVEIGLKKSDPILTIPDLLPHLGKKQMDKTARDFIPAENLNVLVGSLPYQDRDAEQRVKLAILELLHTKYGLTEEDFTSAELQLVPAEPARESGIDGSFIAAYGQDDRVCAYTSFTAILEATKPEFTSIAVFYDKEEIGSEGNTSAQTRLFEMFLMDLMEREGTDPTSRNLNRVFFNARGLSADVNVAFDPTYSEVFEKMNACRLGYGITIEKFSGHGGKYMASDANAEYLGRIRKLCNDHGIVWQVGGHGKVDEGGGGTVAKFLARTGMEIIDIGPPILGMHSPMEVTSKADVWMCHKMFKIFYESGPLT
jgi:aspartyl aminopeptidase